MYIARYFYYKFNWLSTLINNLQIKNRDIKPNNSVINNNIVQIYDIRINKKNIVQNIK